MPEGLDCQFHEVSEQVTIVRKNLISDHLLSLLHLDAFQYLAIILREVKTLDFQIGYYWALMTLIVGNIFIR